MRKTFISSVIWKLVFWDQVIFMLLTLTLLILMIRNAQLVLVNLSFIKTAFNYTIILRSFVPFWTILSRSIHIFNASTNPCFWTDFQVFYVIFQHFSLLISKLMLLISNLEAGMWEKRCSFVRNRCFIWIVTFVFGAVERIDSLFLIRAFMAAF